MLRSLLAASLLAILAVAQPTLAAPARYTPSDTTLADDKDEKKVVLIDLNSATKAELTRLPAVGEAIADRIIAGRPWRSKYDLVVKRVVTRSHYDRFAKLVIARQ